MDTKEAIHSVGTILIEFLKSGPSSPGHIEEVKSQISKIALSLVTSPEEATENYKEACNDYLVKVIAVKGIPFRAIGGGNQSETAIYATESFDSLLPKINCRYNWCIENYKQQSKIYLNEQLTQLLDLLLEFLKQVPIGGTKDKLAKSKITEIKRELRCLTKWTRLFYTLKAFSLASEIQRVFILENGAIAMEWNSHWRQLNYDYRETHKERDGKVYAIRGSWAVKEGLINKGAGYTDEMTATAEEIGCQCYGNYFISPSELPEEMLTQKGKEWVRQKKEERARKARLN